MKLLFTFLLLSSVCLGQSKKDQIEGLNKTIDSLNTILLITRNNAEKEIDILNAKNKEIKEDNDSLRTEIVILNETDKSIINCQSAIGNSSNFYPIRIDGNFNGCIGTDCKEIPSDTDLHLAILSIGRDLNSDSIIDEYDLPIAIQEVGDVNRNQIVDIYDLAYPEKIKMVSSIKNPNKIIVENESIQIIGKLIKNGAEHYLILNSAISLKNLSTGKVEHIDKIIINKPGLVVYEEKTIVIKGLFQYGITQVYKNGVLFSVEEILGYCNK